MKRFVWKSKSNTGALVKNMVFKSSRIKDATIFVSTILTDIPECYYEYKIIKHFKNKFLIRKEILLLDSTWLTISECIKQNK